MLLSGLILAVALQAAPEPPTAALALGLPTGKVETPAERRARMQRCGALGVERTARRTIGQGLKRLGELPEGHGELAVLRSIDGCPVATPIIQRAPAR